jgi:hypothetical protein
MRDPRVDPQPGDALRKGNETRRVVARYDRDGGCGYLDCELRVDGIARMPVFPWLSQWRRWAKDAEVVNGPAR